MGSARGARAPMPQLGGSLPTTEVYEDDCGGGAEGAGGPHVGEILGARVPLGQLTLRGVKSGNGAEVPLRLGEMDCSAPRRLSLSVGEWEVV